ncbi:MAG: cytochrome c [Pseudoxanthomonas sp.]
MTRPLLPAAGLALVFLLPATLQARQDAAASPAPAATPSAPAAPGGKPQAGKELSYTCQGCHGVTGYKNAYPNFHVPRIGGQSAAYLSQALHEYRDGKRSHPTMQAQAQSFSDQDIADLAAYLATLK